MSVDDTAPKQHKVVGRPFLPGQSGNPAGRPKGARSILQEGFFKALQSEFETHGAEVLKTMREDKPADFAKMIASLMTKELTGEDGAPLFPTSVDWNVRKSPD